MSRRKIQGCPWLHGVLALGLATPIAHAQQAAPEKAAQAQDALPPSIGFPAGYPIYGKPTDVLQRPVDVAAQDGDDYVLALAQSAGINLICSSPQPLGVVEPKFTPKTLVRLLELSRDCHLSWWRAGERTILLWPEPDEEQMARAWTAWFREQRARDEASEAVSDDEAAQALKRLKIEDTPQARQELRQDYVAFVRARLQAQVRSDVFQYLEDHPQLPNEARTEGDSLKGRAVTVRDLPAATRQKIETLARLELRQRWSRHNDLWYSPQREEFWKKARLTVSKASPMFPERQIQLNGSDPTGAMKEIGFNVGSYDPLTITPDTASPFRGQPGPRSNGSLKISGKRMPLRQVLEAAGQASGLRIEAPLARLSAARLTLDVSGMQPTEFLEALSRVFLLRWKVEGTHVTAEERSEGESNRFLLQAGNLSLFRAGWRTGRGDRQEEAELARAIHDEVGDAILLPQGVPVEEFSAEVQDGVRREAQEQVLDILLSGLGMVLPASIEASTLQLGDSMSHPSLFLVTANGKPVPPRLIKPPTPAINLLLPDAQAQEIVPLDDPLVAALSTEDGTPRKDAAQAGPEGETKMEVLEKASKIASRVRDEKQRALEAQAQGAPQ